MIFCGKLVKAGSSDDVEIGLYSLDRNLILLRQVRGLARLMFPPFAIFSESPEDFFHAYWQNNGQNEAAGIIVYNNSNQK
jgi:hypothetical protein